MLGGNRWNTFPADGTTMTAAEFLAATEPLLQGVIDDNALTGDDAPVLEAQIRATLGLGTRESSLPLTVGPQSPSAAGELSEQAQTIGEALAALATEALTRLLTDRIPLPAGPLVVRSHCYGHLLTPEAADLLLRRRGGPVTMQLYNEWLHQVVLLRDALLPFTNWQEVPLHVAETGLRHLEPARDAFLTELLVRQIRHVSIVDFARHVVTGAGGPAGYGFDARGGTALPAVLAQPPLTAPPLAAPSLTAPPLTAPPLTAPSLSAPRHLLAWRPDAAVREPTTYRYELADYYAAPRTLVEDLPPATGDAGPLTARTHGGPVTGGVRTAHLEVTHDGAVARVDLGQALRGHRFARRANAAQTGESLNADVWSVLRAPGLVWTKGDGAAVDVTGQDGLVALAVLGRLYPENVTLRQDGPRLVIDVA